VRTALARALKIHEYTQKPFDSLLPIWNRKEGGGADLLISYIDEKTGMSFAVNQWGFASGGAA